LSLLGAPDRGIQLPGAFKFLREGQAAQIQHTGPKGIQNLPVQFIDVGFGLADGPLPPYPRWPEPLAHLEPVDGAATALGKERLLFLLGTENVEDAQAHGNGGDLQHIFQVLLQFLLMKVLLKRIAPGEDPVLVRFSQGHCLRGNDQG